MTTLAMTTRAQRPWRASPRLPTRLRRVEGPDDEAETEVDWDDAVLREVELHGDHTGLVAERCEINGSHLIDVRLTAAQLAAARFTDVLVEGCDLSGADLESAALTRVEFRNCRLSSALLGRARLRDVAFIDCKIDGLNLRMSTGERLEMQRCAAPSLDLSAATIAGVRIQHCDLAGAEFSQSKLTDLGLHGSELSQLRGALHLRGAAIDETQVLPFGMAVCAELGVTIE